VDTVSPPQSSFADNVFQDFVDSASAKPVSVTPEPRTINSVTVLGGGADAALLAALCFSNGAQVQLFSAYASELDALSGGIGLNGNGPVGRYHVTSSHSDQQKTAICSTSSLDNCVKDAEVLFLTGPVHKQRTYAMVLADHLVDKQILVLPNAKTFGALEAAWLLKVGGCQADVTLVELQSLPYWYSATSGGSTTLELESACPAIAACLPATRSAATLSALSALVGDLNCMNNVLQSSFSDCSAAVEIPALLVSGLATTPGGKPIPAGGIALPENASFHSLIGHEQHLLIEKLFEERVRVAAKYGVRELGTLESILTRVAGEPKGSGRRVIPDQATAKALLRDGALASLAPLADAAKFVEVETPVTDSIITLCSAVLSSDLALSGRHMSNLGIGNMQTNSVFARLSELARGLTDD